MRKWRESLRDLRRLEVEGAIVFWFCGCEVCFGWSEGGGMDVYG